MPTVQVYEDHQKQFLWRLVEDNGRIVADSAEGYVSKSNARRAAENFKATAPEAEIVSEEDQNNG
jgi:uncharacterized protein YegP (UPF0339 family)